MPNSIKRITKTVVQSLKPGETVWDSEIKGLAVVHRKTGIFYLLKFRFRGEQTMYSIGRSGSPWTAETARKEAIRLLGQVANGVNPAEGRRQERRAETVADLCDLYLEKGCSQKKESTLATDRGRIERHIKPLLGTKKAKNITRAHVEKFRDDVTKGKTAGDFGKTKPRGRAVVRGGKGTAARTLGLLGAIFEFGIARGVRPDNPVRGVQRQPDRRMERTLSGDELSALGRALTAMEREAEEKIAVSQALNSERKATEARCTISALRVIRVLALSGARKGEIMRLKWKEIDFGTKTWRFVDTKTGQGLPVPIPAPVLEILASQPKTDGNEHVFPGAIPGGHVIGVGKVWERVRNRAKINGARLHDLRHTAASTGVSANIGLPIIGRLLGHSDPRTTQRYSHVYDDPARAAANTIGTTIAAQMNGGADGAADVTDIREGSKGVRA